MLSKSLLVKSFFFGKPTWTRSSFRIRQSPLIPNSLAVGGRQHEKRKRIHTVYNLLNPLGLVLPDYSSPLQRRVRELHSSKLNLTIFFLTAVTLREKNKTKLLTLLISIYGFHHIGHYNLINGPFLFNSLKSLHCMKFIVTIEDVGTNNKIF